MIIVKPYFRIELLTRMRVIFMLKVATGHIGDNYMTGCKCCSTYKFYCFGGEALHVLIEGFRTNKNDSGNMRVECFKKNNLIQVS